MGFDFPEAIARKTGQPNLGALADGSRVPGVRPPIGPADAISDPKIRRESEFALIAADVLVIRSPGKVSCPESGHSFRLPVCCLTEIEGAPDKAASSRISPNLIRNSSVALARRWGEEGGKV
jgi:hypothetical protein